MQPTTMTAKVAATRREDMLRRAQGHESAALTIRFAGPDDRPQLERLAALDARRAGWANGSDVLVAEVNGALAAALPVERPDDAAADPFRRTAELVHLLRARAAQLRGATRRRGRRPSKKPEFRPAL